VASGGPFPSLAQCQAACVPPAPEFLCNQTTHQCQPVTSGGSSLSTCQTACVAPPAPEFECNQITHQCQSVASGGPFPSLAQCQAACVPPPRTHYGDPFAGPCLSDEIATGIQNVPGEVCIPGCSVSYCPTDVPAGVTATPTCALSSSSGAKYCALICSPYVDLKSLRAGGAQCGGANCQPISGTGICTYESMVGTGSTVKDANNMKNFISMRYIKND
jgi:hypothetical protein